MFYALIALVLALFDYSWYFSFCSVKISPLISSDKIFKCECGIFSVKNPSFHGFTSKIKSLSQIKKTVLFSARG